MKIVMKFGGTLMGGVDAIRHSASLAASIRWAPYAYAFVNPIAGRKAQTL